MGEDRPDFVHAVTIPVGLVDLAGDPRKAPGAPAGQDADAGMAQGPGSARPVLAASRSHRGAPRPLRIGPRPRQPDGLYRVSILDQAAIITASAVGGGSMTYSNVTIAPPADVLTEIGLSLSDADLAAGTAWMADFRGPLSRVVTRPAGPLARRGRRTGPGRGSSRSSGSWFSRRPNPPGTPSLEGSRGDYRLVRPVEDIILPPTVHSVLAARIDHLPERQKEVLQSAAVIGKKFSEAVLQRIVLLENSDLRQALDGLCEAGFLYEREVYPAARYAFQHPLTQEVAYRTQLTDKRRGLHLTIARTLTELESEKADENAALIAYHLETAGEVLDAAHWHRRAAPHARSRDPSAAQRHSSGRRPGSARKTSKSSRTTRTAFTRIRLTR